MAMTMDQLKKLVEGEDLKYFIDPRKPALMLGARGECGSYQFVMLLELEGTFLQFRTLDYLRCPGDHPHLEAVLKVLGAINYQMRLLKYGWDAKDGEIVAYADVWLQDGTLTQGQFHRMLANYLPGIDVNYARISKTLETGKDSGEKGGLPDKLRELLESLGGGGEGKPDKKPDEPVTL